MSKKILIVEDDPQIAQLLSVLLSSHKYETVKAANVDEAIKHLRSDQVKFDLVITDYRLPDNNTGKDVAEFIRHHSKRPTTPIIMISADQDDSMFGGFVRSGLINSFLTKPFGIGPLTNTVSMFIHLQPVN